MMGLFDDFEGDFEEVPSYVGVEPGDYQAVVSALDIEVRDSGTYLVLTYTIVADAEGEETPYKGMTQREYMRIVSGKPTSANELRDASRIKNRLSGFGIPTARMKSVEAEDLIGLDVALSLKRQKNNPEYLQVSKATLIGTASTDDKGEAGSSDDEDDLFS